MSAAMTCQPIQPDGLPYPIWVGDGALDALGSRVSNAVGPARVVVVTDDHVGPLYGERVLRSLVDAGAEPELISVPAGDASKSLAQAGRLYDRLAARHHGRDEPIVALGGGVVGDLAGFVAATWHRGVPWIQCPTTLEAAIDASIGGKTAVNHPAGKNLIGAFHRPILVCIDVGCLRTLSARDYTAALAESVKHAVIRDPAFLDWHEANGEAIVARDPAVLEELIARNCRNKAEVVIADERETESEGVGRAALNFGHTIGHAIEAQFEYELRHGEAVALGIVAALDVAVAHVGLAEADRARVESLLVTLGLPVRAPRPIDAADAINRLSADKKVRGRRIRFVLPTRIGHVTWLEEPPKATLQRSIDRIQPA